MAAGPAFLGDLSGRLLPASIPFRFFGAAVLCQLLAWLALLAGAAQTPAFGGGPGLPLAGLHLFTLGVLAMTAIGASLQLLPVATRQAVAAPRTLAALGWLYMPAVGLLALAMAQGWADGMVWGAAAAVLALLFFAALLGRNLMRARGMAVVAAHGGAALLCLLALLASGLSLAATYRGQGFMDHGLALRLHVVLAGYGFMGLLLLGFSYILLPMFALADAPPQRPSLASAGLVIGGLALAALAPPGWLGVLAVLLGLAGLGLHVLLMTRMLRSGMRRQLGRPLLLMRVGWAALAASLLAALALEAGAGFERLRALFVVLLVGGLLSFLLGVLARIVPFLAAMHAPPGRRGPPLPSALTSEPALRLHFRCHLAAFALLLLAVLAGSPWLARAAALCGCVGAFSFAWFFVYAWRRMRAPPASGIPPLAPPRPQA